MGKRKADDSDDQAGSIADYFPRKAPRNMSSSLASTTSQSAKASSSTSQPNGAMPATTELISLNSEAESGPSSDFDSESDSESDTFPERNKVKVIERKGDLFIAPENTVLVHACNCEGSWGAGIAKAFKQHYPDAFTIYNKHCRDTNAEHLVGTCFLIPPQTKGKKHWVGCLFTSRRKGKKTKDAKTKILENTDAAMKDLLKQIKKLETDAADTNAETGGNDEDAEKLAPDNIWMPKINSGLFAVPWRETKALLENLSSEGGLTITVQDKK